MQQLDFAECFESVDDALRAAVAALGGFKKVGGALRPELSVDHAAGWLRDCLNPARRECLHPEQFLLLLRLARQAGFHGAMDFVAFDVGYRAEPVDEDAQASVLQRQFVDAVAGLQSIQAQLQRLQQRGGKGAR